MKNMINVVLTSALALASLASCGDNEPVLTQKDWSGTEFFASKDEAAQSTFYKPQSGYVGDPMPFFDPVANDFKVLYLQDYRPNPALQFHPIWAVSTKDAANYESMGELLSCGVPTAQDAALGTGSTIYDNGVYYTFYTGHSTASWSTLGEAVMVATSTDFKTWKKDNTFLLRGTDYGYSQTDFRDPFVFKGDDGKFHMIVSTYIGTAGRLAEFTSTDLKTWQHAGVFMNMHWDRFYECPDIFKMGDWWYLVYSDQNKVARKVSYFMARSLEELKNTTKDPIQWPAGSERFLDTRAFYAGKTASNGTDRYIWGWVPTRPGQDNTNVGDNPNEPEWAGNLVAHRLIQHEDGTLTLGEVAGVANKYAENKEVKLVANEGCTAQGGSYALSGDGAYAMFSRLGQHNKIEFKVTTSNNWDKFGVSVVRGGDSKKYYTMVVNPENENNRKVNFEEEGEEGKHFIGGADGYWFPRPADNVYNVTIYTDNSVFVMYINDVCSYTNRIYGMAKNCWSINNYGGNITVSDVKISEY